MTDEGALHVVALSGGKDSTALALRLAEVKPREYVYICTPTGDEPAAMFEHWKLLGKLLGRKVVPIIGGTLSGLIGEYNALPNWRQRWCTRQLKIEPYAAWLMKQTGRYERVFSYVGLRADEESRVGGDYSAVPGVEPRFPMRDWGWRLRDVLGYLERRGVQVPRRTDCARCFFQTLGEWWDLWKDSPDVYRDAEKQEAATGYTFRSPSRDSQPAALKDLRVKFEGGYVPNGSSAQLDLFGAAKCRVCRM